MHYIAIFFTWVQKSGAVEKRLVVFTAQDLPEEGEDAEEFGFCAEDIGDVINSVLYRFDMTWENIEFLSGDNTAVNPRLANLVSQWLYNEKNIDRIVPLVGCASHRLNLAVQGLYKPGTTREILLSKVNDLIVELSSLKNRYKLKAVCDLSPIRLFEIRWSGAYYTMKRLLRMEPSFRSAAFSSKTKEKMLSVSELDKVSSFVDELKDFHEVSIWLQTNNAADVTMSMTRFYFDKLLTQHKRVFPDIVDDLGLNSRLIHCPAFENGVVKIQNGDEHKLTPEEKKAVSIFLLSNETSDDEEEVGNDYKNEGRVLKK